MHQLDNNSPLAAELTLLPDPRGVETLYITVKGCFDLQGELLAEQPAVARADSYLGQPGRSSLSWPGEVHPSKPATDVLLLGQAHAPGKEPVTELDVSLTVGPLRKQLRVVGDRTWVAGPSGLEPTPPRPFVTMPLTWERAFGGPTVAANPVGLGSTGDLPPQELQGAALPNLEHPETPVAQSLDAAEPACFAPVAPGWSPRAELAGTYDEQWRRTRAPYLPEDFDPRFFNLAPTGLVAQGHLQGGEPVELINLAPSPTLRLALPRLTPRLRVELAGGQEQPAARLETVVLEPDAGRVCLVWRGALPCDKQPLKLGRVEITAQGVG